MSVSVLSREIESALGSVVERNERVCLAMEDTYLALRDVADLVLFLAQRLKIPIQFDSDAHPLFRSYARCESYDISDEIVTAHFVFGFEHCFNEVFRDHLGPFELELVRVLQKVSAGCFHLFELENLDKEKFEEDFEIALQDINAYLNSRVSSEVGGVGTDWHEVEDFFKDYSFNKNSADCFASFMTQLGVLNPALEYDLCNDLEFKRLINYAYGLCVSRMRNAVVLPSICRQLRGRVGEIMMQMNEFGLQGKFLQEPVLEIHSDYSSRGLLFLLSEIQGVFRRELNKLGAGTSDSFVPPEILRLQETLDQKIDVSVEIQLDKLRGMLSDDSKVNDAPSLSSIIIPLDDAVLVFPCDDPEDILNSFTTRSRVDVDKYRENSASSLLNVQEVFDDSGVDEILLSDGSTVAAAKAERERLERQFIRRLRGSVYTSLACIVSVPSYLGGLSLYRLLQAYSVL
jgi:hypothetical protein